MGSNKSIMMEKFKNTYFAKTKRNSMPPQFITSPPDESSNGRESQKTQQLRVDSVLTTNPESLKSKPEIKSPQSKLPKRKMITVEKLPEKKINKNMSVKLT